MQLSVPLTETFTFVTEGDPRIPTCRRFVEGEAVDESKKFWVSFRQGTQAEDLERTNWTNRRKYSYDQTQRDLVEIAELNPDELARLEIGITLTGTDLTIAGVPALTFTSTNGMTRITDRAAFERWYGLLPSQFCREIYKCCLEVNQAWAPKRVATV